MLYFNWAQTFFLDRSVVQNAAEVALTRVDLYFRAKPPALNNKSGIAYPGVEIKIVPCLNGIPVINQMGAYRPTEPTEHGAKFAFYSGGQTARVEYNEILATTNASAPTQFLFDVPIFVKTDKEYAIIIKFDGSENFVLWTCKIGDLLVDSDKVATGPSGGFRGMLYQFIDDPNKPANLITDTGYAYSTTPLDPATSNNASLLFTADVNTFEGLDTNYLQSNWTPLPDQDLKFQLHVARYFAHGESVINLPDWWANAQLTSSLDRPTMWAPANSVLSNNVLRLTAPVQTTEYVVYDLKNTVRDDLVYGEPFYQDGPQYPGGTATPLTVTLAPAVVGQNAEYTSVLVQANGSYVMPGGTTFASGGGFKSLFTIDNFIILRDAEGTVYIRRVNDVVSNTEILVDLDFAATKTGVTFMKAPFGLLNDVSRTHAFGKLNDLMTLYNSTANSTVRFTSFSIANVSITSGGTGYSNSDYILIEGYEEVDTEFAVQGNYAAYANVVTDPSGVITAIHLSNTGAGFVNSAWIAGANVHIYKSYANGEVTTNPSDGSSAVLVYNIGTNLRSAFKGTIFANCNIINMEALRMKPEITVNNPLGSSFTIRHRTLYHSVPDDNTSSGKAYYIDTPTESACTDIFAKIFKSHTLGSPGTGKTPVLTSRSNDYVIRFANGEVNTSNTYGRFFSNTCVFIFDISSNSDYQACYFDPEIVMSHYGKYIINNEYTNEHTNYGNAYAKHVATKINMSADRFAEDILVYLTAYRPANTDFKVYARLHNSKDEDAFDDTDWTLLEQTDGLGVYSSLEDDSTYIELTYNLPAYPNTDFSCNGSVTLHQGNAHIIGNNTIFGAYVTINNGGSGYTNNDIIYFHAPTNVYNDGDGNWAWKRSVNAYGIISTNPSGVITGIALTDAGYGWDNQSNVTSFHVLHANGTATGGTSANVYFNPGLQVNDLIKIFSPYTDWANTNYTTAVVNSIISNTEITVVRTFGEIGANLQGNVSINTTSANIEGTGTFFTMNFTVGDFIAVWANSSVYETHKITAIANDEHLSIEANGTYVNTDTYYAAVIPDTFMNTSLNVTGLRLDRVAYPHQAWNNMQNDNVARYYNSSMMEFDGYDTMQLKVVFLAPNDINVPKVDDVRGVLVTA